MGIYWPLEERCWQLEVRYFWRGCQLQARRGRVSSGSCRDLGLLAGALWVGR